MYQWTLVILHPCFRLLTVSSILSYTKWRHTLNMKSMFLFISFPLFRFYDFLLVIWLLLFAGEQPTSPQQPRFSSRPAMPYSTPSSPSKSMNEPCLCRRDKLKKDNLSHMISRRESSWVGNSLPINENRKSEQLPPVRPSIWSWGRKRGRNKLICHLYVKIIIQKISKRSFEIHNLHKQSHLLSRIRKTRYFSIQTKLRDCDGYAMESSIFGYRYNLV